jgi:methionyl aminopeptidase
MQTGVKTQDQLKAMREGGKIIATIFKDLKNYVQPDMNGITINNWVEAQIIRHGATPTYREPIPNFPGVICISVNDQVVHGVPNKTLLKKGDLVSFDLVITYHDMKVDAAFTMIVGEIPTGVKKHLLNTTERSLYAGIDAISGRGTRVGDISSAIENVLSRGKLGIIRDLVGHGVGLEMHMPPEVPNYSRKDPSPLLEPGDTLAIEPMATLGGERIVTGQNDSWVIVTKDNSLSAHFEHTVIVTENGADILTQL